MEGKLLSSLGKIAGIGGIALGILFLLFQGVLQQQFASLGPAQAYATFRVLMTFTFGIAGLGVIAWLISLAIGPMKPVPLPAIAILAVLFVVVMIAATWAGTLSAPQDQVQPPPQAHAPAPPAKAPESVPKAPEPPQIRVVIPINICMGNGGGQSCLSSGVVSYTCDQYNAIGGGGDRTYNELNARFCGGKPETAKKNVRHNFSRGGGQCGWTSFTVTCIE